MSTTMTQSESLVNQLPIQIRPGTEADSYAVFLVFEYAYADLTRRLGDPQRTSAADPEALAHMWSVRRPLYEHLAATSDQFWLAKRGDKIIGFARSILRDDLRLLTELFVLPGEQSAGLGRALLDRALPASDAERRWLLATGDLRAQALYLKQGLYPQFPAYYFWRQPRKLARPQSDLDIQIATPSTATIQAMGDLDARLLEHRRDADHNWLASQRQAYLYLRAGQPVGYGYVGPNNGPFALLDAADYPVILAHAESKSAHQGHSHFGLEVPMVNRHAIDYLLANGFHIDGFKAQFMTDGSTVRFTNYIMTSPPFIL
jgi:GNAT superfamily N-acetyltransferase